MLSESIQDVMRTITQECTRCTVQVNGRPSRSAKNLNDVYAATRDTTSDDDVTVRWSYGEGIAVSITVKPAAISVADKHGNKTVVLVFTGDDVTVYNNREMVQFFGNGTPNYLVGVHIELLPAEVISIIKQRWQPATAR